MTTSTHHRLRRPALFAGAALLGAALGVGGSSLALWADAEHLTGQIEAGYQSFAVGVAGSDLTPAHDDGVDLVLDGAGLATTLAEEGEVAVAIQVDSLSQGNKGLRYELTEPDWGTGFLGSAQVSVFWVAAAEECQPGAEPAQPPATISGHTSTPVAATYSQGTAVSTEFWCLHATLADLPDEGEYRNIGAVSATDPDGVEVEDSDDWHAGVRTALDPQAEAEHSIAFTYSTFRPGATL